MRPLEVSDHVALKEDPSLYGYVQRTHGDSHDSLRDLLIIAHTEVSPESLSEFMTTGIPPTGHVFVQFASPDAGSSLVHQDDLVLLGRSFRLGDCVKRDGSPLTGAVIDLQESYILAPSVPKTPTSDLISSSQPQCTLTCPSNLPEHFSHPNPHMLIYDVPEREIHRAQDVSRDDYVVFGNWVGLVDGVEYDVVVMLEDGGIVAVGTDYEFYIPVPDYGKPLIALPDPEGFNRPDSFVATQGWPNTVPHTTPRPGDFVIVEKHGLRNGRWISGSYNPSTLPQGIVMDTRAREIALDWMTSKQPQNETPEPTPIPDYEIELYENIRSFRDTASLRRRKDVIVYDAGKMPVGTFGRNTDELQDEVPAYNAPYSGQELAIGMRVRFRDPTAAAVKYQGINGTSHGKFLRVPVDVSNGWDMNEFEVVFMQQYVTVLWQDGTRSTCNASALTGFALFEAEMAPTDFVLKREGMRQRPVNQRGVTNGGIKDFNEMTFFERPHDLMPTSVGIIQSVDPNERVACVRWYKEPKIELRASGQILSSGSHFGPMGDSIEDVSLYEIMTFPSLLRQRGDICVITAQYEPRPEGKGKRKAQALPECDCTKPSIDLVSTDVNANTSRRLPRGRSPRTSSTAKPNTRSDPRKDLDWVGQVVGMGLDGSITVRLGGLQPCRDVTVDADSVLAVINDRELMEEGANDSMMDIDSLMDSASDWSWDGEYPVSETVEYEGGQRLDNDSGDENWVSDEGEVFEDAEEELVDQGGDTEMADEGPEEPPEPTQPSVPSAPSSKPERSFRELQTILGSEPPPQFLVLDREPPADQFGIHSATTAQAPLKRIAKEHKILANSLPEGEIYVRTYESRLDLLRCLIVGPRDTPYESAPFLVDLYLPARFPDEPPTAHFHSWTSGLGRINPNLYEEGKICLSLLGTWSGRNETEKWSDKATILQLLISLQGLVFVKKPFYNEAGFEGYENDRAYTRESEQYSEKAFVMARTFVKYALIRPPGGLEDVLSWLYLPHDPTKPMNSLLGTIIERGNLLLKKSEEAKSTNDESLVDAKGEKDDATKVFLKPLSRGAAVMLKRSIVELQTQLDQLCRSSSTVA